MAICLKYMWGGPVLPLDLCYQGDLWPVSISTSISISITISINTSTNSVSIFVPHAESLVHPRLTGPKFVF